MDPISWTITIGGGVIVGVVVLFIEYGYFQKRKLKRNAASEIVERSEIPQQSPSLIIDQSEKDGTDNSWPDAINKAVASFSKIHPKNRVEISKITVSGKTARLIVWVWVNSNIKSYVLIVNKVGDILEITPL